jgi:cytosine/adenosine deaminase-related metal-dependent hydrolase
MQRTDRGAVLVGATVVAGDELEVIENASVVVDGGIVMGVERGEVTSDRPVIDASGLLLIPGLINCHTHLGDAVLKERGYGMPAGTNLLWQPDGLRHGWMASHAREERVAAMRRAVEHMLGLGVVAFADFREGGVAGVLELREASAGLPVEAIIYARHAAVPMHDEATFARNTAGLPGAYRAEILEALAIADGFSPVWANEATDVGLREIADLVRSAGKRLATHAGETDIYRRISVSRTGTGDVARAMSHIRPDYVVHMTDASDDELALVVDAGTPIVMCARGQAALGNGFSPYARARALGATIALGTDNAMFNSPDILAEMDFLSRVTRGVTHDPAAVDPRALLAAGTIEAARTLGIADRLGSIAPGKEATFVAVDRRSPNLADGCDVLAGLAQRTTASDIAAVVVKGAVAWGRL